MTCWPDRHTTRRKVGKYYMFDIKQAREEFSKLHTEATKFASENLDKEVSAEDQTAQDARFSRMDLIQKKLDEAEKLAKYNFENKTDKVIVSKKSDAQVAFEKSEEVQTFGPDSKIDRSEYSKALGRWAVTGDMDAKFATLTTATAAVLPVQVAQPAIPTAGNRIRMGMSLVGASPITTPTTAEINVPVVLASVGSDLSETDTSGAENGSDGSAMFSNLQLKCFAQQSGQVWISNLELAANDYDMLGAIVPALQDAKEQRLEQKIMAAIIADNTITNVISLTGTTSAGLTYPALVSANRSFKTKFDRQKVLFLSNEGFAAAESLVGSDGHPVLMTDTQQQGLYRFNGTPTLKSDYLEAFGVSKVVGVIISFVGFRLRDALSDKIIRYANIPTKADQTGLDNVGYHAYGYVIDSVCKLKTSAS